MQLIWSFFARRSGIPSLLNSPPVSHRPSCFVCTQPTGGDGVCFMLAFFPTLRVRGPLWMSPYALGVHLVVWVRQNRRYQLLIGHFLAKNNLSVHVVVLDIDLLGFPVFFVVFIGTALQVWFSASFVLAFPSLANALSLASCAASTFARHSS